ncbi:MAG: DUF6362 family protein [Acidocella sp.]|nr:DUF6362 family protein [Acidocella sp.]
MKETGTVRRFGAMRVAPPAPDMAVMDATTLVTRLERAGATMMAMPGQGHSPRLRQMRFDVVHSEAELAESAGPVRVARPSAAQIRDMDLVFGWLALMPAEKYLLRRVIGARALVHPLTGRHIYSWRRLAKLVGTDHKTVQRWHEQGIRLLLDLLREFG